MRRNRHKRVESPYLSTLSFDCPDCGSPINLWCQDADGRRFKHICEGRKAKYGIAYDLWESRYRDLWVQNYDWRSGIPEEVRKEVDRIYAEDVEKQAQGSSAEVDVL